MMTKVLKLMEERQLKQRYQTAYSAPAPTPVAFRPPSVARSCMTSNAKSVSRRSSRTAASNALASVAESCDAPSTTSPVSPRLGPHGRGAHDRDGPSQGQSYDS